MSEQETNTIHMATTVTPPSKRDHITSYGIICCRTSPEGPAEFLMIQRKDSICYVDFVRGKYNIFDVGYIMRLLGGMTQEERQRVATRPFETVWTQLWLSSKRYNQEYHVCREKFGMLRRGFYLADAGGPTRTVTLADMLANTAPGMPEPEWDFPKGRRSANEALAQCAMREFQEETGIIGEALVLTGKHVVFKKLGCNDVLYKTVLYVASIGMQDSQPPPLSDAQAREVQDVQWFTAEDARRRLHNDQQRAKFGEVLRGLAVDGLVVHDGDVHGAEE